MALSLLLLGFAHACATSDITDLVQSRLSSADDPTPITLAPIPTPAPTNYTPSTFAPTPPPYHPEYRIQFQETWGDDHVCMTEIEFLDQMGRNLPATYLQASSCWGCAVSCSDCTVDYGNPKVLFDGDATTDNEKAYFCSDFGGFDMDGSNGNVTINFNLPTRPNKFSLRRPDVEGSAIAKRFTLSELQPSGQWEIVALAAEMKPDLTQTVLVEATSGPAGRWWEFYTPACMEEVPDETREQSLKRLEYDYRVVSRGGWQNNGKGLYYDGDLGTLTLNDENYYAKQVHFQFPTYRLRGSEQNAVGGELHITHQKRDGKGTSHLHQDGLAIVIIPLRLPLETGAPGKTEAWFESMGLTDLPVEGATKDLNANFSLGSVFDAQLSGSFTQLSCEQGAGGNVSAKKPQWFLMDEPAYVTGKVVQAFKATFPFDVDPKKNEKSYTVWVDHMTDQQMARGDAMDESLNVVDHSSWQPVEVIETPGMAWVPNEEFIQGCGEFQPLGEWFIPPTTTTNPPAPAM
jgi:hypothetical protein